MQLVVNERLVRRKMRLATILYFAAMAAIMLSLLSSFLPRELVQAIGEEPVRLIALWMVPWLALIVILVGQQWVRRWGPRFRQDRLLQQSLKGLDDRHILYAFLSTKLPDYLLLAPAGLFVVVPRAQGGNIVCSHDRWSVQGSTLGKMVTTLFGQHLGNPSWEAARGVGSLTRYLQSRLADDLLQKLPVQGLVVFTNPSARLHIEGCSQTVVGSKELKNFLKRSKGKLSTGDLKRLQAALSEMAEV